MMTMVAISMTTFRAGGKVSRACFHVESVFVLSQHSIRHANRHSCEILGI